MRRGFTLIELLVIIAIIAAMTTVGVVSLSAGRGAVRVRGATRDIFAAIRQARSVALVTQQPAIITYSVDEVDGEPVARVKLTSAKLFNAPVDPATVRTLSGRPLASLEKADRGSRDAGEKGATTNATDEASTIVQDVLFAPIADDVVTGMRLKVVMGDAELVSTDQPVRKPKISLFSNVDYLLNRYKDAAAKDAAAKKKAAEEEKAESAAPLAEHQEPVSIVWETNGRVEPHRVYVYADGQRPEDGLSIRIDRFGAAKVLGKDGEERD